MERCTLRNYISRSLFALISSLVLVVTTQGSALAATTPTNSVNNSINTLKVSPLRSDITLPPGGSAKVPVNVTNLTGNTIALSPIENDFVAGPGESGTPSIILDQNTFAPTHSLKKFMSPLPATVDVPANSTAEVDLIINVPKTAQPGGYFGAVRFVPASSNGSKNVNLSASVASLVLLTVPGPTVEHLNLTNFDVQQAGTSGTNFRTPSNISLLLRFQNTGNIQEAPFGQIYVLKGKKNVYTYNFNQSSPKQVVLPDSSRRWNIPLGGFGKFGKYTVGASLTYGVNKTQTYDVTKTVWIVPTAYIFGGIGIIIFIILLIVGIWFFLRSYKRRILKSSSRRHRY